MNYREVAQKLKLLGCQEIPRRVKGSHQKWFNPKTGRGTVIPDWGKRDLKKGTVRAILKQIGIDLDEFKNV